MKIFISKLLLTFVMFLDSVHSIGPTRRGLLLAPEEVIAYPRRRIVLKVGDIVVQSTNFIGRYYKIGQAGMFLKIDSVTLELEKWMGQDVVITREEFQPGCDLIRNKIFWGTWHEDAFYEIPESERRRVMP